MPGYPVAGHTVAVIGAGPAGLMAAERLSAAGCAVTVYDRMPSAGRKFLMAGRGGLNLTHSEPLSRFLPRYGDAAPMVADAIAGFPPDALRAWAEALDQPTFVGSSLRVFPRAMKASPLLRAWLRRLAGQGVEFRFRADWRGWTEHGALRFDTPAGALETMPDAIILALGGASWPRLGANGAWTAILAARGIAIAPLLPANCGFVHHWTELFRARFAGHVLNNVAPRFDGRASRGDIVVSEYGIEGGAVYPLASLLRDAILRDGAATLSLDLRPDIPVARLTERLAAARQRETIGNVLRKSASLSPVAIGLLREATANLLPRAPADLAALIKQVPIRLSAAQSLERAISTVGGIRLAELDPGFMLRALPGVFAAGEMLDWEAPTGGYLLQACFATATAAAGGALGWLRRCSRTG